jgi:hypothetical protein
MRLMSLSIPHAKLTASVKAPAHSPLFYAFQPGSLRSFRLGHPEAISLPGHVWD